MKAVEYLTHLRHAMNRAGIGFTAYTALLAVLEGEASTVAGLALRLRMSRKGVRDIVFRRNRHFFEIDQTVCPWSLSVSPEGLETLLQVRNTLPKSKPAQNPRKRRTPAADRTQLFLKLQ